MSSPSSRMPLLDPASPSALDDQPDSTVDALFVAGARAMISAASAGDEAAFSTAAAQIEAAALEGHPGVQSALAFLSAAGMTRPASRSRAFLLHKFAADAGDLQSKMALAYSYFRQEVIHDKFGIIEVLMTTVHSITEEAARIHQCKGRVFALQDEPDVARVLLPNNDSPGLAMARAFGDFYLKDYGLISVPEISYRRLTENDEFIILATKGITELAEQGCDRLCLLRLRTGS